MLRVLITGCSSGIGRALADAFKAAGHEVWASARKPEDVTLGEGSTTAILLDASGSTALNGQKDNGLIKLDGTPANLITGPFNHLSTVADRTDQSRIEIVSGGPVALTATWPPVARVIEPFWKSTVPPVGVKKAVGA